MKTTKFNGKFLRSAVTRYEQTPDPADATGRRMLRAPVQLDVFDGLVLDRITGMGTSRGTGAAQITLEGVYNPAVQAFPTRISAFGENCEKLVEALKTLEVVDKTSKGKNPKNQDELLFKDDLVVRVSGNLIPNQNRQGGGQPGFAVREMWIKHTDGTYMNVIPPIGAQEIGEQGEEGEETKNSPFQF